MVSADSKKMYVPNTTDASTQEKDVLQEKEDRRQKNKMAGLKHYSCLFITSYKYEENKKDRKICVQIPLDMEKIEIDSARDLAIADCLRSQKGPGYVLNTYPGEQVIPRPKTGFDERGLIKNQNSFRSTKPKGEDSIQMFHHDTKTSDII